MLLKQALMHLKTISYHKYLVMKGCFAVGLYRQGLLHDLSKFAPSEFFVGAKYFQGTRSPNNAEREEKGYSAAWLHHKGRNKHHYEYWIDYSASEGIGMRPVPMPKQYLVEMFMDRVAASKVYNKETYKDSDPLDYYNKGKNVVILHDKTRKQLEFLLNLLAQKGEAYTYTYIRKRVLKKKHG